MNKADLAKRLAREKSLSPAQAADQLDRMVHGIITRLRRGESASLPGLGQFQPGTSWKFEFDPAAKKGREGDVG